MPESATKKKITIVSAHEGAATWVSLCRFIEESSNYEVRSFHQYDDRSYRSARSTWHRLMLRLSTFVIFPMRFLWHVRRIQRDCDALVVVTSPFFMPILAALLVDSRDTKIIVLMNDIYPEALVMKGLLKRGGVIERFMKRAFARAINKIHAIVFICEHHKSFIAKDMALPVLAPIIPVSAHSDPFHNRIPAKGGVPVEVLYCGTLGHMHDTSTFLSWLEGECGDGTDMKFSFYTSGASKQKFESEIRTLAERKKSKMQILLGNSLSELEWVEVMKRAQVGLVFQDAGSGKVIFPSKVASILASGQAVLAIADMDSDIARLVLNNDCGWVVSPCDVDAFSDCMGRIIEPELLKTKRLNAFNIGHALFGKPAVARQWVCLFDSMFIMQNSAS